MKGLRLFILSIIVFMISGCAAAQIALEHKDLAVQTQMSQTIFLEPTPPEKKTVWIEVKNTSDKQMELPNLSALLAQRGYRVVTDPNKTSYRLQVNILSVGKCDPSALNQSIYAGWGGAMGGAAAGAALGFSGNSPSGPLVGGIVGGLTGGVTDLIAGSLVKNVTYAIVTDIQISEYSEKPVVEQHIANIQKGAQTTVEQESSEMSNWKIYRTRIGSSANRVNLAFEEAQPAIVSGLEKSLAGIF